MPSPSCPTVYAIAAPTPIGAKYMTIFVNLNIVSARLSAKASIGRRFVGRHHRERRCRTAR